jgi:hypothetical protein
MVIIITLGQIRATKIHGVRRVSRKGFEWNYHRQPPISQGSMLVFITMLTTSGAKGFTSSTAIRVFLKSAIYIENQRGIFRK